MQIKEDISYGVIPLIKDGAQWEVFLIHQFGRTGDVYWTFPKGHPEGEESPKEAALRELQEETSIGLSSLDIDDVYEQEYTFPCDGYLVNKKVVYYLGRAGSKTYAIQEDEVKEAGWFTFEAALERLTHERAKDMLRKIQRDIEQEKE